MTKTYGRCSQEIWIYFRGVVKMEWFIKIPNAILQDKDLLPTEKLLYWIIDSLCNNKKKLCTASNQYLSETLQISIRSIQRWIKVLSDKSYIKVWGDTDVRGVWHICRNIATQMSPYNISNKDISKDISNCYPELYTNYYWKDKWIDETVCNRLLDTKLKQWITLDAIKQWMVLYNCECRVKQEWRYVKKFETWIKWFQPLTEEQIDETLTRIIRQHKEKKKSDPKYWQSKPAKTLWKDLCDTFWADKVNSIFKSEWSWSMVLNFT